MRVKTYNAVFNVFKANEDFVNENDEIQEFKTYVICIKPRYISPKPASS